ncbi:MAG: hypothetical protein ABIO18_01935 [Croceibacterium sp.]
MVMQAARTLKIGTIIDKTLGVIEHSVTPSVIYVLALGVINSAVGYFTVDLTAPLQLLAVGLLKFAIGIISAYLLLDSMLRKTGLRERGSEDVLFAYVALSVVYALGVIVGFICVVIPGLIFMARWSIAQPTLVARGGGVMKAMGESWEQTRGNEVSIIAAALGLLVVPIAVVITCSIVFEKANLGGIIVTEFVTSAMNVLSLGMGVALYGLIAGNRGTSAPN